MQFFNTILIKINQFWFNTNPRTKKINHNIVYSTLIRGIGILITLILVPLTLDYLNAYEYGIWITLSSILTWINYFDIGLGNGLRNKLAEAIAKNDLKLGQQYVSSTFFLISLISIGICIILLTVNRFINWNLLLNVDTSINNLKLIVAVTLISICANFIMRNVGVIYLSYQQTWINGLLTCLGSFLALIVIFIMRLTIAPNLLFVAIAYSFSPVVINIVAYPITFRRKYPKLKPNLSTVKIQHFKSLGGLGVKFFFLQVSYLIIFTTSNFIISKIFSPAEVTPYNICFKYFNLVFMIFGIITGPIWTAITDAYTKHDIRWIKWNMKKLIRMCFLLDILLGIMIMISQPIIRWWVGSNVMIPYSLCISIAIYTAIHMWSSLFSYYSNGTGKLKPQLYSMIIAAICFIPLAYYMANMLGVIGVSYAMALVLLIPTSVLAIVYYYSIRIEEKIHDNYNCKRSGTN